MKPSHLLNEAVFSLVVIYTYNLVVWLIISI